MLTSSPDVVQSDGQSWRPADGFARLEITLSEIYMETDLLRTFRRMVTQIIKQIFSWSFSDIIYAGLAITQKHWE